MATSTPTRISTLTPQGFELYAVNDLNVRQVVKQIAALANPLLVIAFGSWARGEHRTDSDLDLAVLLDDQSQCLPRGELSSRVNVPMSIDLLEMTPEDLSSLSLRLNSVQRDIVEDGVVVYRRAGALPAFESPLASWELLLQVKFDEVNLMLKKANSDENALNLGGQSPQIAAFHGQQAVEKLMKAWLIALDVAPPKTHELDKIQVALEKAGHSLPVLKVAPKAFNDYAVRWRCADIPDSEVIDLPGMRETVAYFREHVREQILLVLPGIALFTRS